MISVCMATYNGERFIRQQLSSILTQIGAEDEVIVSDDGSTDGTLKAIADLNDARVRVMEGPRKGSPTLNFEHALKAARGEYIFLSDQDDVWREGKVEVCMEALKHHYCVVTDAIVTDTDLNETAPSFIRHNGTRTGKWYNLLVKNGYLGCCMAFRREVARRALPFPPDTPMHDIWIGNVAAFKYDVCFIDKPLICFRRHGHSSSTTARKSSYSFYDRMLFRAHICKGLLALNKHKDTRL